MKKHIAKFMILTLVLSFVLVPFASARAESGNLPSVTPLSGDKEFSTTTVDPVKLPGAVKLESGLFVPVGFGSGDLQFSGDALVVKDLSGGKALACFSLPGYRYGWTGNVHQWNGSKWMVLPSSTAEGREGGPATVCATIYGDGTYALLSGFHGDAEPKIKECLNIEWVFPYMILDEENSRWEILFGIIYPTIPLNTAVSYSVIDISPAGALTGDLTGSGEVFYNGTFMDSPFDVSLVLLPEGTYVYYDNNYWQLDFTLRIFTLGCYKDFHYPEDLELISPT